MKNSRHFLRALSLILAMATVFLTSSFTVVAEDSTVINQNEIITDVTEEVSFGNPDEFIPAVYEVEDLREENVKHFSLPDGTYQAVSYSEAVHRKNEDGEWVDIDNRLVSSGSDYATEDGRISFVKSPISVDGGSILYTLTEGDYMLTVGIMGTDNRIMADDNAVLVGGAQIENHPAKPEILVTDSAEEQLSKLRDIDNTTEILYEDILDGTDIEYVITGNDVKENIIVKEKRDSYTYTFAMIFKGLTAESTEDGSIILADIETGEPVYYIPAPYMYDAAGEISYDVSYTLTKLAPEVYTLAVTADETWINADDRAFPVVIDPVVRTNNFAKDTYVSISSPHLSHGSETELWVSNDRIALVQVALPQIPPGATFNEASLGMYYYYWISTGQMEVGIYEVMGTWNDTVTYATLPGIGENYVSSKVLTASSSITESTPRLTTFDVTDTVRKTYSGNGTWDDDYGFAFMRESTSSSTNASVIFRSYETHKFAILAISYSNSVPDGVYALQTNDYTTLYMSIENDIPTPGANLQYKYLSASPAASATPNRSGLFKISRPEGSNTYVIRSMLNNRLTIDISGDEIVTKTISASDEEVAEADKFNIWWSGTGFIVSDYSGNAVSYNYPNSEDLTVIPDIEESTKSKWKFEKYYGSAIQDMDIYSPSSWKSTGITAGTSYSAYFYGWSTVIGRNEVRVSLYSGNDLTNSEASWNSFDNTLSFTASNPGSVSFRANMYSTGSTLSPFARTFSFNVVPEEGTYYLQNVETERYMDVEGPSTASGANIQQWDFHTGNSEKWELLHVENSGGYVRFKSKLSNLYLGVNSDIPSLIQQYSALDDSTLWKIQTTPSGNVRLNCKAWDSQYDSLYVPLATNANGTDLTNITYTDDTDYGDEWAFRCIIDLVPLNLRSNSSHLCIPCAITNIAAYWCIAEGYTQFGCLTAMEQEVMATLVHNTMIASDTTNNNSEGCNENVNIPVGFDIFSHEENGKTYTLTAELRWYSEDPFDYKDVMSEINSGRPFLLGFGSNAFYGGGHMTVCVGYEISGGKFFVYVSDAWDGDTYRKIEFLPGPGMNDFIATVVVTEEE